MAKGDLVLMTVQDARPRSIQLDHSTWSMRWKATDSMGSAESKPCPVKRIKTRFNGTDRSVSQTKMNVFDAASIQEASPEETMKACSWDNVNALYRKSSLLARSVSRCPIWRGHVLGIGYAASKRQNWLHPSIQSLALPPSTSRVHPKAGFLHPLLALPSLWMPARTSPMWGISRYHTSPQNLDLACAHLQSGCAHQMAAITTNKSPKNPQKSLKNF